MKIITIPHPTLRAIAQPVVTVDKKLLQFIEELETTLVKKENPRGVGLAAPQVDVKWRIFATQLPLTDADDEERYTLRSFINPKIIDQSLTITFGPDKKHPTLEGCLSIPGFYGPVPRAKWVILEYQQVEGNELVTKKERFEEFAARVIQHENDHLNGVLFIDYIASEGLPLYKEDPKSDKLVEIDQELIPALVAKTK